jgi:TPR repeat protein
MPCTAQMGMKIEQIGKGMIRSFFIFVVFLSIYVFIGCLPLSGKTIEIPAPDSLRSVDQNLKNAEGLIKTSPLHARKWLKKAAELGHFEAALLYSEILTKGIGGPKEPKKAFYWVTQAYEGGAEGAAFKLALHFKTGLGTKKSSGKYLEHLTIAAGEGSVQAQFDLSVHYLKQKGKGDRRSKAFYWTEIAARSGKPAPLFNLAEVYRQGIGVPVDYHKAFLYYQKVAEFNDPQSFVSLGNAYKFGQGPEKDMEKAAYWYQKAFVVGKLNDPDILYELGNCHRKGSCLEKNNSKALVYYLQADKAGNKKAAAAVLALGKDKGFEGAENRQIAITFLSKALHDGRIDDYFFVARSYLEGWDKGTPDYGTGGSLLFLAQSKKDYNAKLYLVDKERRQSFIPPFLDWLNTKRDNLCRSGEIRQYAFQETNYLYLHLIRNGSARAAFEITELLNLPCLLKDSQKEKKRDLQNLIFFLIHQKLGGGSADKSISELKTTLSEEQFKEAEKEAQTIFNQVLPGTQPQSN